MDQQKIVPSIWCNNNVEEVVAFYESTFGDVQRGTTTHYPTEGLLDFQLDFAGKPLSVEFTIYDLRFLGINAGNEFHPNPSISFMVSYTPDTDADPQARMRAVWDQLAAGGNVLMPLDTYDFSPLYGWVQDKFGVSWQLIFDDSGDVNPDGSPRAPRRRVMPTFLFSGDKVGSAEAAGELYVSVFPNSHTGDLARYGEPTGPASAQDLMFSDFSLNGEWFAAMDSGNEGTFPFSEAVSLLIECEDQEEIDRYWNVLSTVPEAEVCGWCKDEFGVSWQIAPRDTARLTENPAAYSAMMGMKKIVIADLEEAAARQTS